jgi:hypothetical protein
LQYQLLQLMKFNFFLLKGRGSFACLVIPILLALTCSSAVAQNRSGDDGFGVALSTGYDVPVGNLGYTFKPATTYGFTVMQYKNGFTGSITVGYHFYQPKQDTFYYAVNTTNYGTISYKNFTMISAYLGGAYNVKLTDDIIGYVGLDFGVYYSHMYYTSADEYQAGGGLDAHEEDLYVAPKVGINYLIGDNMAIGIEGKYNSFAPSGQKEDNPLVGTIYSSYAATFIITYNF